MIAQDVFIHPKGIVDDGAEIGAHTRVWAFAHVLRGAKVGSHCNICDFAFVETGATLGNHVTVKNGVHVWEAVTVEDGAFLGPSCVFTNDLLPRAFLKREKKDWLLPTFIREGATIGANATIVCGTTVGRFAFVGAGAVVTKDVPDHALVFGNPARVRGWLCRCATALTFKKGAKKTRCAACGLSYAKSARPPGIRAL